MHVLAEAETSDLSPLITISIIGGVLAAIGATAIYVTTIKDASRRNQQSAYGVPAELQGGHSGGFYLALGLGAILAFVGLGFALPFAMDLGEGLAGEPAESSTVQSPASER